MVLVFLIAILSPLKNWEYEFRNTYRQFTFMVEITSFYACGEAASRCVEAMHPTMHLVII